MSINAYEGQKGNVLFLILIAVALFAALSFAVTSSTRSGGGDASNEDAELMASQIIQYGTAIDGALQRMRMSTGMQDWQFDFSDNSVNISANANTNCTSNNCRLFVEKGGQISSVNLGVKMLDQGFRDAYPTKKGPFVSFKSISVVNVGSSLPEVVMIIQGMNLKICQRLNLNLAGINTVPQQALGTTNNFSGALSDYPAGATYQIGDAATEFRGKFAGCFKSSVTATYANYFQVLYQR